MHAKIVRRGQRHLVGSIRNRLESVLSLLFVHADTGRDETLQQTFANRLSVNKSALVQMALRWCIRDVHICGLWWIRRFSVRSATGGPFGRIRSGTRGRVRRRQVWLEVDQLAGGRDPVLISRFGFKLTAFGRREGPRDSVDTRATLWSRFRIAEFGKGPRGADDRRTHVIRYLFWMGALTFSRTFKA